MEREEEAEPSGGAGGKFRNQSSRNPRATPYDRPPRDGGGRQMDGWISRLFNPASRLLSRGTTILLPSVFSERLPPPSPSSDAEMKEEASYGVMKNSSDNQLSTSMELGESSKGMEQGESSKGEGSKGGHESDELAGDKLGGVYDGVGLTEIEQLLKKKTFSRDEFNRLTELLRSRTAGLSDDSGCGKKKINMMTSAEEAEGTYGKANLRASVTERELEHLDNKLSGRISNPLPELNVHDEVGASPVEIAKAFMGRAPVLGPGSQSGMLKDERVPPYGVEIASKSFIPSPVLKSPTCWPGAMVHEDRSHLTLQTQRGRIGLHNLPRTPYSGAVHLRSNSKFQGSGGRPLNLSSTHWKKHSSSIIGDAQVMKRRISVLDDGIGSVGPVHRIQNSMVRTPAKVPGSSHPASDSPSLPANSNDFSGYKSTVQENMRPGILKNSISKPKHTDNKTPRVSFGSSTAHPESSVVARKILEHLDRTVPTPKEKSAELMLAISKKEPPLEFTTNKLNDQFSRPDVAGSDSRGSCSSFGQDVCSQGNGDKGSCLFQIKAECKSADQTTGSIAANILASNEVFSVSGSGHGGAQIPARSSVDSKKTYGSQIGTHEVFVERAHSKYNDESQQLSLPTPVDRHGIFGPNCSATGPESLHLKKSLPHSSRSKPKFTSISVIKQHGNHLFALENGSGFTFPFSTASGALSEPPTPTMIPTLLATQMPEPKEGTSAPSFSFGSSSADEGLVFSFVSNNSSASLDASTPQFTFQSDKGKVSFRSAGEDASCY